MTCVLKVGDRIRSSRFGFARNPLMVVSVADGCDDNCRGHFCLENTFDIVWHFNGDFELVESAESGITPEEMSRAVPLLSPDEAFNFVMRRKP